jgi:hypothetical protein
MLFLLPIPALLQARAAVQQQAEAAHIVQHHLQQQQLPGMPLAMPVLQVRTVMSNTTRLSISDAETCSG